MSISHRSLAPHGTWPRYSSSDASSIGRILIFVGLAVGSHPIPSALIRALLTLVSFSCSLLLSILPPSIRPSFLPSMLASNFAFASS